MAAQSKHVYEGQGTCPICEAPTTFVADNTWYRDYLVCGNCGSIPRERALMYVLNSLYPNWRNLAIHESSPVLRGASLKLKQQCVGYVFSQFDEQLAFGRVHPQHGYRSEDLERQTFDASTFDIVVTQDVFEHLFDPIAATKEIMRTLKPGGSHIFSVPIVRKANPSRRRATRVNGVVAHLADAQYHGNPMSEKGALVTIDWGYDILEILSTSGHPHVLFYIDNIDLGIRAELIDIVVGRKSSGRLEI